MRNWPRPGSSVLLALIVTIPSAVVAATADLGGDARYYQFVQLDEPTGDRRDSELGILRLKGVAFLAKEIQTEAHGVLTLESPAATLSSTIATATTRQYLDLRHEEASDDDLLATLELDRLNLTWEKPQFRLTVGRQAISWGVNFFWPALDLFAPFSPARIDREYKPGVDAVRVTLALGELSQLEVAGAGQGSSLSDDGSVGALLRVHLGLADIGTMLGRFHHDTVAGGFITADLYGTGARAEVSFTDSGDPRDSATSRSTFWRIGGGVDRQLTPTISCNAEVSWNEYGATRVHDYVLVATSDRYDRGEITSLARTYAGTALTWQAHPLLVLTTSGLWNIDDGSILVLPYADWSLSDNLTAVLGGAFGIGPGPRTGPFGIELPRSEYGSAPQAIYAALKTYF